MTEATSEAVSTQAEIATNEDWRSSLPEDIRSAKAFDSVKDVGSLAKQFLDAQSHIGNSIRIPSEDAGEEAKAAFHEKLMSKTDLMVKPQSAEEYQTVMKMMGAPDEASGYEIPEGVEANYDHLKDIAHKSNMTNKQFETLVATVAELDGSALESQQVALQESRGAVQKEWGAAFDRNQSQAIALLEATDAPESVINEAKSGAINGEALKWFYNMAQKIGGGEGKPASQDLGGNNVMTPNEAATQLAEMMDNRESPYWDAMHPRHKEFQDKAMRLRKFRGGNAA